MSFLTESANPSLVACIISGLLYLINICHLFLKMGSALSKALPVARRNLIILKSVSVIKNLSSFTQTHS
jgi:hypothetical protein